jgi:hypothetical protein
VRELNDKTKVEGSGGAECLRCTKPNNSLDASGMSKFLIDNLNQSADASCRVNSGVRHASRKQDSRVAGDKDQKSKRRVE